VSESNLAQVTKGQPCEVSLDALPGSRFRAVVHTVVPTADRSKASVMVKIRFIVHDPRILPEMSAKVAFLSRQVAKEEQQPRVAVNAAAIIGVDKNTRVYRIVDGRARAVSVTTGARYGDLLAIHGLKPGEKVILKPLDSIMDGSRVTVREK
jgi:multidrug efflux pump subunit AcrA (membrane-fusion protein)